MSSIFRHVSKFAEATSVLLFLSVRMEHVISNWMTFSEMEGCYNLPRKYNLVKIGEK
jgi:hypothetical protein